MNKIKSFYGVIPSLLVIIMLVLPMVACSNSDNDSGGSGSTEFVVNKSSMTFTNNGGSNSLAVQAGSEPTITSSASWCTASLASKGTSVYNYTITTDTYTGDATTQTGYDDRTATLTVSQGTNSKSVTITQTPEYGLFISSEKTVSVDAAGSTVIIKLKSNSSDFEMTDDADWITVPASAKSRAALTDYTRTVTVASNISSARTGKVSFTLGSITESVTINQLAGTQTGGMPHSAKELAKLMYPGWNLGNTMEAGNSANNFTNNGGVSAEMAWQNTKTTQAIIDYVKLQGFKSVRIPCSWVMGHITDKTNCTIDDAWMSRVQEIVDYCIKDGLYVELNDHWDGGWLENSFSDVSDATVTANSDKLTKIWTQIANHFKAYDEHLMFGGLNEPGINNSSFDATTTAALIKYEQVFIDAVRATGGNNATRTLVVQGPSTNIDQTYNLYDVTKLTDTAADRLIVEVHFYDPWQFTGLTEDATWGKMWYYWGTGNSGDADRTASSSYTENYVSTQMAKMKTKFVDKGYPVIIGEYGANYRFANDDKHNASIKAYYKAVNQYAIANGCVPFAWDTNYTGYPNMTIINRATTAINNQYMLSGVTEGVSAAIWPY